MFQTTNQTKMIQNGWQNGIQPSSLPSSDPVGNPPVFSHLKGLTKNVGGFGANAISPSREADLRTRSYRDETRGEGGRSWFFLRFMEDEQKTYLREGAWNF